LDRDPPGSRSALRVDQHRRQVLQDPQLQARDMFITVSDADGNTIQTANNPIRLSASGERPKTARSPLLD
jgi:crotonobetainyl-CoA:carnitine CoA-transferase CaiB-like acyl-CoA transferase